MIGKFSVPMTRGNTGRKIDTWQFAFPDGSKTDIEVFLKTDAENSRFIARSKHPLLKEIQWDHSDIQVLRSQVGQDIENTVLEHSGDKWAPAYEVEFKRYQSRRSNDREFHIQMEFTVSPVMLNTERPPSNRGERAVLRNGQPSSVIERGFGEGMERPDSLKGPLTPDRMRELRFLEDTPAGRSVARVTPDVTEACARIERTLARFAEELGNAVGANRVDPKRLPTPEDLATFMAEAAREETGTSA